MTGHIAPLGEVTMNLGKPGLAAGTTTTVTVATLFNYVIDGVSYSKAAVSNAAHPTTDAATGAAFTGVAANKGTIIFYLVNAAGTLGAAQGTIVDLDAGGAFITAPRQPAIPDGWCPFGYLTVAVGSTGSTWTAATSNQASATGVTYSRKDIFSMPQRLKIA